MRRSTTTTLRLASVAVLSVLLLSPAASVSSPPRVVKVALTRTMGAGALILTADRTSFAGEGVTVELDFLGSDAAVRQAVARKDALVGATELTAETFAAAPDIVLIASEYSDHAGFPSLALVIAKSSYERGFKNIRDLQGKRVAVDNEHASPAYALSKLARRYAFDPARIRLVPMGTPRDEIEHVRDGRVDAAVVPYRAALEAYLAAHDIVVVPLADLVETQTGVIFTAADELQRDRETVARFVRAYQHGIATYALTFLQRSDGDDVFKPDDYAQVLKAIAETARVPSSSLDRAPPYVDRLGRLDIDDVAAQFDYWRHRGLAGRAASVAQFVDTSLTAEHLQGIAKQNVIERGLRIGCALRQNGRRLVRRPVGREPATCAEHRRRSDAAE